MSTTRPAPQYFNRKPGWRPNEPPRDVQDALTPYLALGFTPIFTAGGKDRLCAYHALSHSLISAIDVLGLIPNPAPDLSPAALQQLQKSPEYTAKVKEVIESDEGLRGLRDAAEAEDAAGIEHGEAHAQFEEYRRAFMEHRNLDRQAIKILLDVINDTYSLSFDLAIITQGFWVRYNPTVKLWERNYQRHMAVTAESEVGNRPVLFIWNDNAQEVGAAHSERKGMFGFELGNHWEGFVGPEYGEGRGREERLRRVQEWDLGALVGEDVQRGVWRVTKDLDGSGVNGLEVRQGAFVRRTKAPSEVQVPVSSYWMRTCGRGSQASEGVIRKNTIMKINLHATAPGRPFEKEDAAPLPTEEELEADRAAIAAAKDAAKSKVIAMGSENLQVKFFRIVEATDKAGQPLPEDDPVHSTINGFDFTNGEFFLDGGQTSEEGFVNVKNIDGVSGLIHLRNLQLLDYPWSFPTTMRKVIPQPSAETTNAKLRETAAALGLGTTSKTVKAGLLEEIQEWRKENTVELPLYRLRREVPPEESIGVRFLDGEIVTESLSPKLLPLVLASKKDNIMMVVDFEGNTGWVERSDLEEIDNPFGLELYGGSLPPGMRLKKKFVKKEIPSKKNKKDDDDDDDDRSQRKKPKSAKTNGAV